jgi:hypothetical protein
MVNLIFLPFGTYRTHNALKNIAERKVIECTYEAMSIFHMLIAHLFCQPMESDYSCVCCGFFSQSRELY